jgi:hypothetical protein
VNQQRLQLMAEVAHREDAGHHLKQYHPS